MKHASTRDPALRPVMEDQLCDGCRHPRWMHHDQVNPHGAPWQANCHFQVWAPKGSSLRDFRCQCQRFIELDERIEA